MASPEDFRELEKELLVSKYPPQKKMVEMQIAIAEARSRSEDDDEIRAVAAVRYFLSTTPDLLGTIAIGCLTLHQLWHEAHKSGIPDLACAARDLVTVMMLHGCYAALGHHPSDDEYVSTAKEILFSGADCSDDDLSKICKAYKEVTRGMPHAFESATVKNGCGGRPARDRMTPPPTTEKVRLPAKVLSKMRLLVHTAACACAVALGSCGDLQTPAIVGPAGLPTPACIWFSLAGVGREFGILVCAIRDAASRQWNFKPRANSAIVHGTTFLYMPLANFDSVKFEQYFGPGSTRAPTFNFVQGPVCQSRGIHGLPHRSVVDGLTVENADLRKKMNLNVLFIRRGNQYLRPEPTEEFAEGDMLILFDGAVTPEQLFLLCAGEGQGPGQGPGQSQGHA